MPSVYIKTYGCQMNERDSEAVAAQLVAKGYTLAPSEHSADVILLNTFSVRDTVRAVGGRTPLQYVFRARHGRAQSRGQNGQPRCRRAQKSARSRPRLH